MNKYSGNWLVLNNPTLNTPLGSSSYFTITIVQGTDDSGYIIYQPLGDSGRYYSSVSGGKFLNWHKIANDETVVHNSGNETILGNKTFTSPITGRFATRILDVNDLLLVTQSMNKYSGNWLVLNNPTLNTPLGSSSYFTITIVQGTDDSGYIIYQPLGDSGRYYSSVSGGKFLNWHKIANDETVVHNSGNETINGVKTFGSNIVQPKSTATVNFQNGFTTASVPLMLTRVGNIVSLTGRMIPNTSLNKDAITTAFTIPQGFKPANQFGTRQAGAYGYSYLGEFYPDGHFEFSAYSNNGTYVQPSNNEIHVNATWLTFD